MAVLEDIVGEIIIKKRACSWYNTRTTRSPDARSFVLVWQHASSLNDVRDTLIEAGANTAEFSSLQSRAARYRQNYDIPLQALYVAPSHRWEDLAQLARQIKSEKSITKEITE
tara:strand:+ start:5087 stop:5425 length:339 start_codon:yes stop_codon:yes gene_type:complete